jgi:hypothetical protein
MTVAGRVATVGFLALAPVLPPAAPATADVFLQAQTTATAVHVTVTQQPAGSIITASLLDDAVAYAAGDYDSGGSSEALSAPAFPGRLVVQGPQLLCSEVFDCPATPPAYPLLADASYPRRPRDRAAASGQPTGSGPFVVTPVTAGATAGAAGNSGTTNGAETSLLAGTPGALTLGASSASSALTETAAGLHVHVASHVSDITIAGVVHIAAVSARDDIVIKPGKRPVDTPSVTVTGVTVAGRAASIDDRGVHVIGTDAPSVGKQLDRSGVQVRLVGSHRADTAHGARSDATALEIDVAMPVSGVPYVPNPVPTLPPPFDQVPQLPGVNANGTYLARVTVGAVGAAAGFGQEPSFDLGSFGTVGRPAAHGGAGGGSAAAGAPGSLGSRLGGSAPAGAAPPPQVAAPQAGGLRGILDGFTSGQIESLYAVVALGAALLFVGWRGAVLLRNGPPRPRRRR